MMLRTVRGKATLIKLISSDKHSYNVSKLVSSSWTRCFTDGSASGPGITNYTPLLPPDPNVDRLKTMNEMKEQLRQIMGADIIYNSEPKNNKTELSNMLPQSQAELKPRKMTDSFDSIIIPLATDTTLQNQYTTMLGTTRTERVLEDMDLFAVWVAMKHIENPRQLPGLPSPYVIVTALIDHILVGEFASKANLDLRMSGHVSWVGKSSMECSIWVHQFQQGSWIRFLKAYFVMVARNPEVAGPAIVNPLLPQTNEEKQIFHQGQVRNENRKKNLKTGFSIETPNVQEQEILHDLFKQTVDPQDPMMARRILPQGTKWMHDTLIHTIHFPQPENRNFHNKIYGGYLLKIATELAWISAVKHSKSRPNLRHMRDIVFRHPVKIGDLLNLTSRVLYTEDKYMQIAVTIETEEHDNSATKGVTTNILQYTYEGANTVPKVVPHTYQDSLLYLSGRKMFKDYQSKATKVMNEL